ncbi:MAG: cation:proton antiporter [Deltaproteobacteria bacterium]|nr:cation:proton antiporter [Deltaproteobacteria bacterium]
MEHIELISLTIFAGIFSQILAYKLRLPAIVPLLVIGVALGQSHILDPHALGAGLHTIVQLGVAIILFEGGLSLKVRQFKEAPLIIRNLVSVGVLITWLLSAGAAYLFIPALHDASGFKIALLFGALITVSGPTVIMPLLKIVKPVKKIASVLKWEGILIDPIGALLAVVLLTFINTSTSAYDSIVRAFLTSLSIGLVFGGTAALMLNRLLQTDDLIPEEMRNLLVLTTVFVVFAVSNWIQTETGILSVTVAGFALGILGPRGLKEIESFKGQLTTLMVSILFILLAARLDLAAIWNLQESGLLVLLSVLFIIRPLNVFVSGYKSRLSLREKIFLSWMAPRGIVAAAVASLFAEILAKTPEFAHQASLIESLTFLIIGGTVFFQGATARFVGKLLKVIEPDPNGVVIIGANLPARYMAKSLKGLGIDVMLLDSNSSLIAKAKKENIPAEVANAISQETIDEFEIAGFGKLLALTPNEKINILACQLWAHEFGKNNVFRVGVHEEEYRPSEHTKLSGEGRLVFPARVTQEWLQYHLGSSWDVHTKELKTKGEVQTIQRSVSDEEIYPLALIHNSKFAFYMAGMDLAEGRTLLYLKKTGGKKNTRKREQTKEEALADTCDEPIQE